MPTTTNFGWTTPADTDLVKDGALAIRTLGNGIDTSFLDLKGGTTNQVLSKASNTDLDFTWVTPASGGKILQVVNATYGTQAISSTSTYADTGLTATITPSATSSKILVLVSQSGVAKGTNDTRVGIRLVRGSTTLITMENFAGWTGNNNYNGVAAAATNYLDSPSTTSATTYKTQFASLDNVADAYVQRSAVTSTITLLEIGA